MEEGSDDDDNDANDLGLPWHGMPAARIHASFYGPVNPDKNHFWRLMVQDSDGAMAQLAFNELRKCVALPGHKASAPYPARWDDPNHNPMKEATLAVLCVDTTASTPSTLR